MRWLYDHHRKDSWAASLRRGRMDFFRSLLDTLPKPVTLLDAGGTEGYWTRMGFAGNPDYKITLLNLEPAVAQATNFISLTADVRDLRQFQDKSFDVVFSNSVIEHVGGFKDQQRMADELKRVGKNLFLQTPNRFFPVEPHFVFPLFQFLPDLCRAFLIQRFNLGWRKKIPDWEGALREARSVQLLSRGQLRTLFPEAHIRTEYFLGLSKSFMVVEGFQK